VIQTHERLRVGGEHRRLVRLDDALDLFFAVAQTVLLDLRSLVRSAVLVSEPSLAIADL